MATISWTRGRYERRWASASHPESARPVLGPQGRRRLRPGAGMGRVDWSRRQRNPEYSQPDRDNAGRSRLGKAFTAEIDPPCPSSADSAGLRENGASGVALDVGKKRTNLSPIDCRIGIRDFN